MEKVFFSENHLLSGNKTFHQENQNCSSCVPKLLSLKLIQIPVKSMF